MIDWPFRYQIVLRHYWKDCMGQLVDFNRDIYLHLHAGTGLPLRLNTSQPRPVVTVEALPPRPIPFSPAELASLACATILRHKPYLARISFSEYLQQIGTPVYSVLESDDGKAPCSL
jgi:hypothetical protein